MTDKVIPHPTPRTQVLGHHHLLLTTNTTTLPQDPHLHQIVRAPHLHRILLYRISTDPHPAPHVPRDPGHIHDVRITPHVIPLSPPSLSKIIRCVPVVPTKTQNSNSENITCSNGYPPPPHDDSESRMTGLKRLGLDREKPLK